MTSEADIPIQSSQAYVWVWLPGTVEPVVAGRLFDTGASPTFYGFNYGRSYLERKDAIPLSPFEFPLRAGAHEPSGMLIMPSCIRDAGPDAWGRRILESQQKTFGLNELDYLLQSGSDRIGALDFQLSSQNYIARRMGHPSLDDLHKAAQMLDQNQPLPPELEQALLRGTSVGGARPKAVITDGDKKYIAKFSSSTDTYDVIRAEYIAMKLARICELDVAEVSLATSLNKQVLLVERFDRESGSAGTTRRILLSGLGLMKLDEMEARYASYPDLADIVRQRFENPQSSLRELFRRLVFNVLIGNTDDHARNHAAFWDGQKLELAPAYDICPQPRTGGEASQGMQIQGTQGNLATLDNVRSIADRFMLTHEEATQLANGMVTSIRNRWDSVCDSARLAEGQRQLLWGKSVFSRYCFQGW